MRFQLVGRSRSLVFSVAFALGTLAGCGPREPRVVVHSGEPVIVDPKPDKPGFDPASARLRAASREVEKAAGHAVVLHVDAALLSNDPHAYESAIVASMTGLANVLASIKRDDEKAFAFATKGLDEIFVKYEPLADPARAHFDREGKRLVVETRARVGTPDLVPFYPVKEAFDEAWEGESGRRFADGMPSGETDREAYFEWLVRTRPGSGSVLVKRAAARATSESREEREREAAASVRLRVLELVAATKNDALRTRAEKWLVDELPRIEHTERDEKKLALLPRDSAYFEAERAYDKWVARRILSMPAPLAERLGDALFPRGFPCGPDEARCSSRSKSMPGVDRMALGFALLDEARRAGFVSSRTEHSALVSRIVCPAERDARGKPSNRCNASFAAHLTSTPEGRSKLVRYLTEASGRDRVEGTGVASEVAATLSYARPEDLKAYLRALEGNPAVYKETVRALVFAGIHEHDVEEETRHAFAKGDPELRAAAATVLAKNKRELHRHYSDGYFERFEKEWGTKLDAKTVSATLAGSPRSFVLVPLAWKALDNAAKVEPFLSGLDRLIDAPEETLDEPKSTTIASFVRRLCEDKAYGDLDRVHRALEKAAKSKPENARKLGNAVDDSVPKRCPKVDAPEERDESR